MEQPPFVAPGVARLTVNLDEEDVGLFEGLWPVPDGVALHAYLVRGDRAAVIDPWDAGGYGPEEVEGDLQAVGLDWTKVTAVAFTKAPAADLLERLRVFHPGLEDWGTPADGTRHDLGGGVVLEARGGFWVVVPAGVALTGDAFAGLGWVEDELWSEDLDEHEARYFEGEALRWFAARPQVPVALPEGITVVAPAHGCLFRDAGKAADRARKFASWAHGAAEDEVSVVWPTGLEFDAGADALVGGILETGAGLTLFRVPGDDPTAQSAGARRASLVIAAEGLDTAFLAGLEKDLWRPSGAEDPAVLRAEASRRAAEL